MPEFLIDASPHPSLSRSRAYRSEDMPRLLELLSAAGAWAPIGQPSADQLLWRWARRGVRPEDHVRLVESGPKNLHAYWLAAPFKDATGRLGFDIAVHPGKRRQGLGSTILALIEADAARAGSTRATCPVYVSAKDDPPVGAAFLEKRGYSTSHGYWQMRLDNISRHARSEMPPGISVRTLVASEPDLDTWCRLVIETFGEETTRSALLAQMQEPGALPGGYFFAVDDATGFEVGTSRGRIDTASGPGVGYVGTVGVAPPYRRRGIAQALVRHTLAYLASLGLKSATLFVERQNEPARRIYDSMGWYSVYRTDHYWKDLSALKHHAGLNGA